VTDDGDMYASRPPVTCGIEPRRVRIGPHEKRPTCVAFLTRPEQEPATLKMRLDAGASLMSWKLVD
jgi:hypothetical protein